MFKPIRFVLSGLPFNVRASFFAASAGYAAWFATFGLPVWMSAVFVVMLFASTVVHELGHAFALRAFGVRHGCVSVNVHALGGHVTFCEACHARLGMGERFAMSVAGPLAGFALAVPAAALCVFAKTDAMFLLASGLVVMNLLTSAANLLPVYPLDGGHATEAALRGLVGGHAIGEYATIVVSGACLTALIGASVWYGEDINLIGRLNIAFNLLMLAGGNLARVMRSD